MSPSGPHAKERPGLGEAPGENRLSMARRHAAPAIAAVLISLALFIVVHNEERLPANFDVTVIYDHPEDVLILGDHPEVVRVKFQATRNQLHALSKNDFRVIVPNRAGTMGPRLEVLAPDDVEAPRGVIITEVLPSNFTVEYDRRVRKRLPLEVLFEGKVAEDHEVDTEQIALSPAVVHVIGPRSLLRELDSVQTLAVDLEGRASDFRRTDVALEPLPPLMSYGEGGRVEVSVPIRPIQGRRTMTGAKVVLLPGPWRAMPPNPRHLDVILAGPLPSLRSLKLRDLKVLVDPNGLEPQDADYKTDVLVTVDQEACPSCTVVTTEPQSFVHLRVLNQATRPALPSLPQGSQPEVGTDQAAEGAASSEPQAEQASDPPATTGEDPQNG